MNGLMAAGKVRRAGTHYVLRNHGLVDTIIAKARIRPTDSVLEIAAGTGCITLKLLAKARKVIAFEDDSKMAMELASKVNRQPELESKLVLITEDVLGYDIPHFDICISNIPFDSSLPVMLKLISCDFKCAYLLMQREFGARLTASPGSPDYSRLSVIVQLLAHVEHVAKVSKNSFVPAPSVDSCFIKIEPRVPRPPIDVREFDNLLEHCFGRKNKTLAANLKSSSLLAKIEGLAEFRGAAPADIVDKVLESIGMTESRPAKTDVEDFLALLLEFKKIDINFS